MSLLFKPHSRASLFKEHLKPEKEPTLGCVSLVASFIQAASQSNTVSRTMGRPGGAVGGIPARAP